MITIFNIEDDLNNLVNIGNSIRELDKKSSKEVEYLDI